jgi:hypothetical protein
MHNKLFFFTDGTNLIEVRAITIEEATKKAEKIAGKKLKFLL